MTHEDKPPTDAPIPPDPRVIVVAPPGAKPENPGLKILEQLVTLIKALVWPVLIATLLYVYRTPMHGVAKELPGLVARTQKLSAGGLAIEMQAQAEQKGGTKLAEIVTTLSGDDVQGLLGIGCVSWGFAGEAGPKAWSIPNGPDLARLYKFEADGLIHFDIMGEDTTLGTLESQFKALPGKPALEPARHLSNITIRTAQGATEAQLKIVRAQYRLTPLGRDAYNSILAAITSQLPGKQSTQQVGCSVNGH
ncbi:MAG: hypothetical protein ABSE46_09625 [Terracidiphilus sp.]|jgi:hypothetical protein